MLVLDDSSNLCYNKNEREPFFFILFFNTRKPTGSTGGLFSYFTSSCSRSMQSRSTFTLVCAVSSRSVTTLSITAAPPMRSLQSLMCRSVAFNCSTCSRAWCAAFWTWVFTIAAFCCSVVVFMVIFPFCPVGPSCFLLCLYCSLKETVFQGANCTRDCSLFCTPCLLQSSSFWGTM